jgi:hypothetical protein
MPTNQDSFVAVQRSWTAWRTANLRLTDLESIHWRQPVGAPRALIHAWVACTKVLGTHLAHDCGLTSRPHRLLVCVLKQRTMASVYAELVDRAARIVSQPDRLEFADTPSAEPPDRASWCN